MSVSFTVSSRELNQYGWLPEEQLTDNPRLARFSKRREMMNVKELLSYLVTIQNTRQEGERLPSVILEGSTGVGKSTVMRTYGAVIGIPVIVIEAAKFDPSDIAGMPFINKESGKHQWTLPYWFPTKREDIPTVRAGYIPEYVKVILKSMKVNKNVSLILFFDELTRAHPDVLNVLMNLILNGELHDKTLPEDVWIIAATNPQDGDYNIVELDPAVEDRLAKVKFCPDLDEWCEYARDFVHPGVISFLNKHPQYLRVEETGGERKKGVTYRTMFTLGRILNRIPEDELKEKGLAISKTFLPSEVAIPMMKEIEESIKIIKPELIVESYQTIRKKILDCSKGKVKADILTDAIERLISYMARQERRIPYQGIIQFLKDIPREMCFSFFQKVIEREEKVFKDFLKKNSTDDEIYEKLKDEKAEEK